MQPNVAGRAVSVFIALRLVCVIRGSSSWNGTACLRAGASGIVCCSERRIEDESLGPAHCSRDRDDNDREPSICMDPVRKTDYGCDWMEAVPGSTGIYALHHLRNLDDAAFGVVYGQVRPSPIHDCCGRALWCGMGRNGPGDNADATLCIVFNRRFWGGACLLRCDDRGTDRKSTRLNSSHRCISYAVFC